MAGLADSLKQLTAGASSHDAALHESRAQIAALEVPGSHHRPRPLVHACPQESSTLLEILLEHSVDIMHSLQDLATDVVALPQHRPSCRGGGPSWRRAAGSGQSATVGCGCRCTRCGNTAPTCGPAWNASRRTTTPTCASSASRGGRLFSAFSRPQDSAKQPAMLVTGQSRH
jgi:hypothetical protein